MAALILETTFLIDLEREARKKPAKAHRFIDGHLDADLYLSMDRRDGARPRDPDRHPQRQAVPPRAGARRPRVLMSA
jgi:hypothetical protein